MSIALATYNLNTAERLLCETALTSAGSIVEAAKLLGITRHALKRRIIKHGLRWSRAGGRLAASVNDNTGRAAAQPVVLSA